MVKQSAHLQTQELRACGTDVLKTFAAPAVAFIN